MKKRFLTAILCQVVVIAFFFPSWLAAQELPLLADLAKLRLNVINTEVVDKLPSVERTVTHSQIGGGFIPDFETSYYTAPEGRKIVVVTLKGKIPYPCRIFYTSADFGALYDVTTSNAAGEKKTSTKLDYAAGVTTMDDWLISKEEIRTNSIETFAASPFIFRIAFYLPKEVNSFFVRYPTAITEKVALSKRKSK